MATLTETVGPTEALVSEGNGDISREVKTIVSGQNLKAGAVVGKITTGGKYTAVAPAATDGSQVAAGVLHSAVDASSADTKGVLYVRNCELNSDIVQWTAGMSGGEKTTATAELATLGIILR